MTDLVERPAVDDAPRHAEAQPRTVLRTLPVPGDTDSAALPADAADPAEKVAAPARAAGWPVLVSRVLVGLVLVAGWALAYVCLFSGFQAAHEQRGLYDEARTQLALGTAPTGGAITVGAPVAVLDIPALRTGSLVVVEGTAGPQLQDGPGHQRLTPLPGQPGWSVLYGRALSFGGFFAGIDTLAPGARIDVTTGQGRFRFRVTDVRRTGDVVTAPATGRSRLSLVTATGSGPFAALSASRPVVVDADLVGRAAASRPPTAAVRSSVTAAENPMAVDTSVGTVLELVLTLQLVVVALLGSVWAWSRWSRPAAWLVGAPVVIASLWLCSGFAARLLPNLL